MVETININWCQTWCQKFQHQVSKLHQRRPQTVYSKHVILIAECFCSRYGHINQYPPSTWRETTGDNGRQNHFRAQEADHTNQHPPPIWRETTGDNGRQDHFRTHMPTTPTNTHPHIKGDNRRQRETRPLQRPRSRPHQPTPRRPDLKLH